MLPLLACFLESSARHNCNSACDLILGSKSLAHGSFRIMGSLPTITWRCQHELNYRVERARVEVGVMIPCLRTERMVGMDWEMSTYGL